MDTQTALKILQSAVDRRRVEDTNTPEFNAALDLLKARASVKWPFDQFRNALKSKPIEEWEIVGRCQVLNAAMNGIRRAVRDLGSVTGR
jgi:aspartyl/asparaginyl beta-hydroxylase (cupin superfamily)